MERVWIRIVGVGAATGMAESRCSVVDAKEMGGYGRTRYMNKGIHREVIWADYAM
jgi:hypothetical protein